MNYLGFFLIAVFASQVYGKYGDSKPLAILFQYFQSRKDKFMLLARVQILLD